MKFAYMLQSGCSQSFLTIGQHVFSGEIFLFMI
jgi:hypothetical protein